ncbi:MAG: Lrp/AsnC ligand binding domain-containing protein [Nitratireductor sp.]
MRFPKCCKCHSISGEFDFILRVVVGSVRDYEKTVKGKLLKLPNVGRMNLTLP